MKLKDVAKGSWAIRPVTLRLVNTSQAAQPGAAPSGESVEVTLGVRLLTGEETAQVYQKAQSDAAKHGVTTWIDEHPLCRLMQAARTLELACVDIDSDPKAPARFFESAEEVLTSPNVGTDNIAYLFERWQDFVDDCSIESKTMTADEVVATILAEAERPENAPSPLVRMRPGLRASFLRTTAVLFSSLATSKSPSGSPSDTGTGSSTSRSGTDGIAA